MSLLYLRGRPIVAFNETNPLHREYYHEFMKRRSWGQCPVRFMVEGLNTSLVHHISERILNYYVKEEFPECTKQSSSRVKKEFTKRIKKSKLNKNGK